MKRIKFFENFSDDTTNEYDAYAGLDDDIESILVELSDFGLKYNIYHNSGMSEYMEIVITDINEQPFWFSSNLYERLLFLTEFITKKYPISMVTVADDFMSSKEFPFPIEEFSDEVSNIDIQIYYTE